MMTNLDATGGVAGPGRIGRVAIGDLLKRAARRFPERVAITDGSRQVTFTELERDANRFANYLVAKGLKPGEKIATVCNNSIEYRSGERTNAMLPSRGGRLMVMPSFISRSQVA